ERETARERGKKGRGEREREKAHWRPHLLLTSTRRVTEPESERGKGRRLVGVLGGAGREKGSTLAPHTQCRERERERKREGERERKREGERERKRPPAGEILTSGSLDGSNYQCMKVAASRRLICLIFPLGGGGCGGGGVE